MPLVTLKCKSRLYPSSRDADCLINWLRRDLPDLLTRDGHELLLDEGTPREAVQVEVQKFGEFSVNIPDIWLSIQFTEDPPWDIDLVAKGVRGEITRRVANWMGDHMPGYPWPKLTLDIFWGPGHGCMLDEFGDVHLSW